MRFKIARNQGAIEMNKQREALEAALNSLQRLDCYREVQNQIEEALAEPEQEPVVLPDGSAFSTISLPLPKDHWLTQPRQYATPQSEEPVDLPAPFVPRTVSNRELITLAARYAIRAATDCGKESDFDPDAMVQAFVYATLGPYPQRITSDEVPASPQPREWKELSEDEIEHICGTGPVYAPNGVVIRTPIEYRNEIKSARLTGVHRASAALRAKNEVTV